MPRTVTRVSELARAAADPTSSIARLRQLVLEELRHGREELTHKRSGYERPLIVPVAEGLVAAVPVDAAVRVDVQGVPERGWLLTAAVAGSLIEVGDPGELLAGDLGGFLTLHLPGGDAELAQLAFEEQARTIDRLRAQIVVVPADALPATDLKPPLGPELRVAEAVARLGGRPADPASVEQFEAQLTESGAAARPHEDPDPARRIARRILQRLNGMGKWGGYHTEFAHLPRGFAGNDRALAIEVGEALLEAGLLAEKPSVGQRHVFLNPRRAGDIHRMIETGDVPNGLTLPASG
jgi:hypothetical protein